MKMPFEYTLGADSVADAVPSVYAEDAVPSVYAEGAAIYDSENERGPSVCED